MADTDPDADLVLAIAEALPEVAGSGEAVDLIGELFQQFPDAGPDEVVLGIATYQHKVARELGVTLPRWRPRDPAEVTAAVLMLPHLLLLGDGVNMARTSAMVFA